MRNGSSIIDLVKGIPRQIRTLVREEVQLAKTELSEKISKAGKYAGVIAVGGLVAYAGLIVFLGALGLLLAFVFRRLGLEPALAAFVGLGIIGFVVMGTGAVLVLKGLKAFKAQSLAPKRTIETLQRLKGDELAVALEANKEKDKEKERTSAEIEASVMATELEMAETLEELEGRLTLRHMREQATAEIRSHPYRWGLVAMGAGLAG